VRYEAIISICKKGKKKYLQVLTSNLFSVAAARLGLALGATQGVSRTAAAWLWLELAFGWLSPAKFGNNCLRLCLDLATHNSTSTATQGIYEGQ